MSDLDKISIGDKINTNSYGICTVIEYLGKNSDYRHVFKVRFDDTGFEDSVLSRYILNGTIRDKSLPKVSKGNRKYQPVKEGDIYKTNNFGDCKVVRVLGNGTADSEVEVNFLGFDEVISCSVANLRKGTVSNPYFKSIANTGYIGEGSYTAKNKAYSIWREMLLRCYDTSHPSYNNGTVLVHTDWFNFQIFAEWYSNNYVDNYQLDKDIIGSNIYGPKTCIFVPQSVNSAEAHLRAAAKEQPELTPIYDKFIEECIRLYKT